MTIDPRLQERRKEVAEDRARRKVGRLLKVWLALVVAGLIAWILLSPWLDADRVETAGIAASEAHSVLAEAGVVVGRPLILIRAGEAEAALESDPYVADAEVTVEWPDLVVVRIEERRPVAWVETAGGWAHRAADGVALPSPDQPDDTKAWIRLPSLSDDEATSSRALLGALEFVAALPEELAAQTTLRIRPTGELWAEIPDFDVRLGRPIDMEAKALSLAGVLEEKPPRGSLLTLIAPAHPAYTPPQSRDDDQAGQP
jgi:cell division protein FtsQ